MFNSNKLAIRIVQGKGRPAQSEHQRQNSNAQNVAKLAYVSWQPLVHASAWQLAVGHQLHMGILSLQNL